MHSVEFMHPFGRANPLFRRIFNRKVEAGGASETVTQNGYLATEPFKGVWGPVYRMLADLGDPAPLALAADHRAVRASRLAPTTTT